MTMSAQEKDTDAINQIRKRMKETEDDFKETTSTLKHFLTGRLVR